MPLQYLKEGTNLAMNAADHFLLRLMKRILDQENLNWFSAFSIIEEIIL